MQINRNDTAVVFIDPQNEVLSEKGAAWAAVRESVTENKTVEDRASLSGWEAAWLRGVHLSSLRLPHGQRVESHRRCQSSPGVGSADQRSRAATAQARYQQGYPRRNVGEYVRRISLARSAGAGF